MNHIPAFVFLAYLTFSMVGLAPFSSNSEIDLSDAAEGSIVRPMLLGTMCAALVPTVVARWHKLQVLAFQNLWLVYLVVWSGLSVTWAIAPEIAIRRWILAVIVIFLAVSLTALLDDTRRLHKVAVYATGAVMIANYLGAIVFPDAFYLTEARGTYWTGMHPHKNNAGLVAALSFMIWFFAGFRFSPRWLMWGGAVLWLIFLLQTGSRTSQFALFVAITCTLTLSMRNRYLRISALCLVLALLLLAILSITVGILPLESVMATLFGETTFTGRTVLWQFLVSQIYERPLSGVGIGSFWGVNDAGLFRASQGDWFATTVQGHNGYLDVTVTVGMVGLVLCIAYIVSPFRSIIARDWRVDAGRRVFCAVWLFSLIHNFAESTILRGDSILWILTLVSVLTLRSMPHSEQTSYASYGGFGGQIAVALRKLSRSGPSAAQARRISR